MKENRLFKYMPKMTPKKKFHRYNNDTENELGGAYCLCLLFSHANALSPS